MELEKVAVDEGVEGGVEGREGGGGLCCGLGGCGLCCGLGGGGLCCGLGGGGGVCFREEGFQIVKVEALGGAKAEHNAFVVEVEVGEGFGFFLANTF